MLQAKSDVKSDEYRSSGNAFYNKAEFHRAFPLYNAVNLNFII